MISQRESPFLHSILKEGSFRFGEGGFHSQRVSNRTSWSMKHLPSSLFEVCSSLKGSALNQLSEKAAKPGKVAFSSLSNMQLCSKPIGKK